MSERIIMKTNVNKTSTGIKMPALPKPAKGMDRIVAGAIDLGLLFVGVKFIHGRFDLKPLLLDLHPQISEIAIFLFLYVVFTIIPHAFFSQTIGKMVVKIKVVNAENYTRLNFFKCLFRDILLRPFLLPLCFLLSNKEGRAFHDRLCGSVVVVAK